MIKMVAHYHPQFCEPPGDPSGQGRSHADWAAVSGARPLFAGHAQPRRLMPGRTDQWGGAEVLRWQADLALAQGIYGFCFHHYWAKGRPLWERPAEWHLADRSSKLQFCLAWANEPLGETGPEDRQGHFSYVAQFFEDPRYIRIDKKPVFLILDSGLIPEAGWLLESWNASAVKRGFPGICFIQVLSSRPLDRRVLPFSARVYDEPGYTLGHGLPPWERVMRGLGVALRRGLNRTPLPFRWVEHRIDYDGIYQALLRRPLAKGDIPGAFTDWDDSPRRGYAATVFRGSTPAKFEAYLLKQIEHSLSRQESDLIFINAWNGWLDGACLEPGERYGNGYLEAIASAQKRSTGLNLPLFYRTIF